MLDALKKLAKGKDEPSAELQSLQAEFSGYKETAEALMAQMESDLAAAKAQAEQLSEKLAAIEAAAQAEKAAAEKAAAEAAEKAAAEKAEKRLAALQAAVGDEKAGEVFASLSALPDATFDAVVNAMASSYDAEAAQDAAGVQGVEAEVQSAPEATTADAFKQFLRARHGK